MPIKYSDHDLSADILRDALHHMAVYLNDRSENITLITVGGAINVLHLGTRDTTHDVDVFGSTVSSKQMAIVEKAAKKAESQTSDRLGGNWLNNMTRVFMSSDLEKEITQAALAQNVVIFAEPGLTVLAAPWAYCVCGKLNRLSADIDTEVRQYDVDDAVQYLHELVKKNKHQPVMARDIEESARRYKKNCSDRALRLVATEYQEHFGRKGLV